MRSLDEAETTISEGVREMACRVNQDASSFDKAAANLRRTAHIEVSKETLRELVETEGRAVLRAMRQAELSPRLDGGRLHDRRSRPRGCISVATA